MKHVVENDFQQKIMYQSWSEPCTIATLKDVQEWRDSWSVALKSWHSPYKTLIDLRNVTIQNADGEVVKALQRTQKFFEGFFLKKAIGFGCDEARGSGLLPFPHFESEEKAREELGLRGPRGPSEATDFRSTVQLQNHFNQHVVELSFSQPVVIKSKAEVVALKSKLTNNLMQWHSKWSLLIDCVNLKMEPDVATEWANMERYLKGFFLKTVLGYAPAGPKESYPFEVYRARHNAAGRLEGEGNQAGDDAACRSKA